MTCFRERFSSVTSRPFELKECNLHFCEMADEPFHCNWTKCAAGENQFIIVVLAIVFFPAANLETARL